MSAFVSTSLAGFGKPPRAGEVLPKILLIVFSSSFAEQELPEGIQRTQRTR
jgi:hypothetical protein